METINRQRSAQHLPCDRCGRPSARLVREDIGLCARHLVNFDGTYRIASAMAPRTAAHASA